MKQLTLRQKFMIGFILVITPLVALLYYNNYYATDVVRNQVSQSNSNLLSLYVKQIDKLLNETTHYMYWMEGEVYELTINPAESDEYQMARVALHQQMSKDLRFKTIINAIFIYNRKYDDLILSHRESYPGMQLSIEEELPKLLADLEGEGPWQTVSHPQGNALAKIYEIKPGFYVGAWLSVENLINNIPFWEPGAEGGAVVIDQAGKPLSNTKNLPFNYNKADRITTAEQNRYQIIKTDDGKKFLEVTADSTTAPLQYAILLPEDRMLMNLPYFKRTIYMIPIAVCLILIIYLLLFTRILYKPIHHLLEGMKKIQMGQLDIQVQEAKTPELNYLIRTFNLMVSQIHHLRINIYEEELRAKKAELRQLQIQINPHFYMNTLYIIYNFAALKDYTSVQKMSIHLANYFRYIMKTQDALIPLKEEMEHITIYLEIQKMRFANGFSFEIVFDGPYESFPVPPLSIQPFVENAVIHGYSKPKDPLHVGIHIYPEVISDTERYMVVQITDTGKGFAEEQLLRMQDSAYFQEQSGKHIGIWNVYQRLQMQYGEKVKITFANGEEKGAIVRIRFPLEQIQ